MFIASFGSVTRGVYRSQNVAVKKLLMQFDEGSLKEFEQEVTLMKNLHHPNIIAVRSITLQI
jgi:serine/threonine protein kinase